MRRIGLLGGMSWESTAVYYRLLNEAVRDRLGGLHSADLLLRSIDFARLAALQEAGDWDAAGAWLAAEARELQAAGAELVVICANTMHLVADAVSDALDVELVHIMDATADAAHAAGATTVGVVGTAYTMEHGFYADGLRRRGLEPVIPGADDRAEVHRVIFEELVLGRVLPRSKAACLDVIGRLVDRGAQAVMLACTELDLLLGPEDGPVPLLDTTAIHVERAVSAALAPADAPASFRIDALDHLVLTCADVEATVAFYRDVLEMRPQTFEGGRRALTFGRQKLNLHQAGDEIEPHAALPAPGSADVCLLTPGPVDAVADRLRAHGVAIEVGPVDRVGAVHPLRSVYFRDPDGNLVEVAQQRPAASR